eukprot:IDg139t1
MSAFVRARLAGASPDFLAPELCWRGNAPKTATEELCDGRVGCRCRALLHAVRSCAFGGKDDTAIQEIYAKTQRIRIPLRTENASVVSRMRATFKFCHTGRHTGVRHATARSIARRGRRRRADRQSSNTHIACTSRAPPCRPLRMSRRRWCRS